MLLLTKIKQQFIGFFHAAPPKNSKFGLLFQIVGLTALLYGTWMIYPPLPFLLGGIFALIVGERL